MSNKTSLQTNNTKIGANNNELLTILNTINNLPQAGASGGSEDLTSELIAYDTSLTTQETTIQDIISALEGKVAGGGITPTGTLDITENGTYDVTNYENANVNVAGSGTNANEVMAGFFNDTIEVLDNEFITYTHSYCICNKNKLKIIRLPSVTTLNGYAISSCTAVHTIEFETLTKMVGVSFNGLTALETLIIRTPSVCSLANASALSRTKIEAGTGYIYVPDNLVDSYKTATNWSTYASQIKGISELE